MGLLTVGKPLNSAETKAKAAYVRDKGITQFLHTWNRVKDIKDDELRFGDEVESGVFVIDNINKTVKLSIRSSEILEQLSIKEEKYKHQSEGATWHPEFGGWMIESTPSKPYSNYAADLLRVERNMILRRRRILSVLKPNEISPTVTCFPLMGVGDFIHNPLPFTAPFSQSIYVPDYIINQHPRFGALTSNIRSRRQSKVDIRMPLYRDFHTPEYQNSHIPVSSSTLSLSSLSILNEEVVLEDTTITSAPETSREIDTDIHMDCMAFGMGMCCLQVTFQARDVDESRYMYDQLAVLAPIMLAMTAATPIFKGRLSERDARWDGISQSVDDRTPAERGEINEEELKEHHDKEMVGEGVSRVYKSRYDSVSTYIYHCKDDTKCRRSFEKYNDIPCPVDEAAKQRLLDAGIDENLAHHLAHLFTRDPLVLFEGLIEELNDELSTDHFENIQSTNWQTCRWKPPPPRSSPEDPHIGWRTEFRSMETQLTDFENAAFTVFIALVTRVLLAFDLSLYIPLSKVDENMKRAQMRGAVEKAKFFFRKHVAPLDQRGELIIPSEEETQPLSPEGKKCDETSYSEVKTQPLTPEGFNCNKTTDCNDYDCDSYEEMNINEIFNGKDDYYPGLIPLVYAYVDYIECDAETFAKLDKYLRFISKRAKGDTVTTANWIRNFVRTHPAYQQDSIVSQEISHDLMIACDNIGRGLKTCPEILGRNIIEKIVPQDAYGTVLPGQLSYSDRTALVQKLMTRAHFLRKDESDNCDTFLSYGKTRSDSFVGFV